jgi:hypothetical protein
VGIPPVSRPHPRRRAAVGIVAGLVAFAATLTLAVTRNGGADSARPPTRALSSLGELRPLTAVGPVGPEGVPVPPAPALAPTRLLTPDEEIDGVACQSGEQASFHIHAHLTIFVRGAARRVPAGIGIGPPYQVTRTSHGAFVAGGSCFTWLHTHAADGVIHTESPIDRTYTLGDFFDIWGQQLGRDQVGAAHGQVTALFDGLPFSGNPRTIPLLAHAQIQLEVDRPLLAPEQITFPPGL